MFFFSISLLAYCIRKKRCLEEENVRLIEVTRFNSNSIYASFVHHSLTRPSCFMHSAALCVAAVAAVVVVFITTAAAAIATLNDSHFIRCHENM